MTHAIEADALQKTFRGKREVRALDGVSFGVEEGTVFGLLGPNGSGKTTAVRILTTILKPDGGSARVLGHDVTKEPGVVRSLIGLAGQYAAVDENLTGRENLVMVGRLNHLPGSYVSGRAKELLTEFDLTDAGDRPLKTYSGGMRRRLDLAAALVARPTVLFLDEPSAGLDPQSRLAMWTAVQSLRKDGITVVLTTHYMEEADALSDRVAIVDHGRLLALGSPQKLKETFGAQTTIQLTVRQTDRLPALASELATRPGVHNIETLDDGLRLFTTGAEGLLPELIHSAASLGLRDIAINEPSLETVFIQLTGRDLRE